MATVREWFNDAKGYGFITPDGGKDVFVITPHPDGGCSSRKVEVEYEVTEGPKGAAANVRKV